MKANLSALAAMVAALPTKTDFCVMLAELRADLLRRDLRRDRLAGDPGERRWIAGRWRYEPRGC
jgi:hypothetical protein